jgi:hypothetical protein
MSADKKPEDQITEAGAVELDESRLDDALGGLPAVQTTAVTLDTSPSTFSGPINAWPTKYGY